MRLTTGAKVSCTWLMEDGCVSLRDGGAASFRGCDGWAGLGGGGGLAPGLARKASAAIAATLATARDTVFMRFSLSSVTVRFNVALGLMPAGFPATKRAAFLP